MKWTNPDGIFQRQMSALVARLVHQQRYDELLCDGAISPHVMATNFLLGEASIATANMGRFLEYHGISAVETSLDGRRTQTVDFSSLTGSRRPFEESLAKSSYKGSVTLVRDKITLPLEWSPPTIEEPSSAVRACRVLGHPNHPGGVAAIEIGEQVFPVTGGEILLRHTGAQVDYLDSEEASSLFASDGIREETRIQALLESLETASIEVAAIKDRCAAETRRADAAEDRIRTLETPTKSVVEAHSLELLELLVETKGISTAEGVRRVLLARLQRTVGL